MEVRTTHLVWRVANWSNPTLGTEMANLGYYGHRLRRLKVSRHEKDKNY